MELSKRLYAVAALVTEGASVADVGTDHGYIPIYQIQEKIASRVIAMDINKGPLERARIHIEEQGLSDRIETRLSDGTQALVPGEADTLITAGMGGGLVIHILEEGKDVINQMKTCILQPQSEIDKVRRYLTQEHFLIVDEDMVEEDGKYYPILKVEHGESETYEEYEFYYGKKLLEKKHPVLRDFLLRECAIQEKILKQLNKQADSTSIRVRKAELAEEMLRTKEALERITDVHNAE